jgi:hypothetical protein
MPSSIRTSLILATANRAYVLGGAADELVEDATTVGEVPVYVARATTAASAASGQIGLLGLARDSV